MKTTVTTKTKHFHLQHIAVNLVRIGKERILPVYRAVENTLVFVVNVVYAFCMLGIPNTNSTHIPKHDGHCRGGE